ncbi:MAG: 30S ribosomal protein S12 methylthiotransferase RimO [Candidatus Omnitrophica bacterium]|nr:30S ribosomal protein S12 methylthiotransferase RimO [Candidatus Omnitrophota bacterium]
MKKIFLLSLGCPRNMLDSEVLLGLLEEKGFAVSEEAEGCDVAIVNTCGFIQDAKEESINAILQLAQMKKEGRVGKLLVAGCLSQRYPAQIMEEISEIDGLFGTSDLADIPGLIDEIYMGERIRKVSEAPRYLYSGTERRKLLTPSHSVYVKIQDGCSNMCSYCVIPALKGPHRSRTVSSVMEEVRHIKAGGKVRELILIGQDTTAFGSTGPGSTGLPELIRGVSGIMEDAWVRLLYTHPARFTDDLIKAIAESPNVCKYVDLPVQHINDRILSAMSRRVTRKDIEGVISRVRSGIPGAAIRTSVIVGFPGETDDEFRELMDFIDDTRFEKLGAFIYSREEGTRAYGLKGQVPEKVKKERLKEVMLRQQRVSSENNLKYIGKILKVLVDEKDAESGQFIGRTESDAPEVDGCVFFKGEALQGEFARVRINGTMEYDLTGETV